MTTPTDAPEAISGPLWPDAYAVRWPRSGGAGTCSHHAPDSCGRCDGTDADARDVAKRAGATR